ncbi:MAG TPA: DapH/DapD/GlmU-related protein [Thermoanaerobaculia bacterium]|nr:DapH/DapD/GlmU-related protein [Thermoanaerobaculia bacterium]
MSRNLREDTRRLRETHARGFPWYVLESLLFDNGYQAVLLHRLAHWFRRRRIPIAGPALARLNLFLTGVDIAPAAEFGPGLRISHGVGVVVGNAVRVGRRALIMQGVTLGAPTVARIGEMPRIGDDVVLGAYAAVIGGVTIGDRVLVAAHVLVTESVPDDTKVLPRAGVEMRPRQRPASA